MDNRLIIYHDLCSDGIGAAWCFHKKMPNAVFHAARHGTNPPDVTDKIVYIVDFAYSRPILLEMKSKAKSIFVLDHHKSNMESLGDLDFCLFDMKRSGAGMAWDYLFPDSKRSWVIDYTEDKDIWKWSLPNSREINCVIQSYPLTFDSLYLLDSKDPKNLISEGDAILRHQRQMVTSIANKSYEIEIQGYKVLIVNSPVLQSEVASFLSINRPFGVVWFENEKGEKIVSLRSRKDDPKSVDVAIIASKYPGGGGHRSSAGFKLIPGNNF